MTRYSREMNFSYYVLLVEMKSRSLLFILRISEIQCNRMNSWWNLEIVIKSWLLRGFSLSFFICEFPCTVCRIDLLWKSQYAFLARRSSVEQLFLHICIMGSDNEWAIFSSLPVIPSESYTEYKDQWQRISRESILSFCDLKNIPC